MGTAGAVLAALVLSGCGPMGPMGLRASETWTHSYPLSENGEVTIANINGRVEIEGVEGSRVEVQAEKIAYGATEQIARDLLPKIPIEERATPDFVSVETRRISGFLIGAGYSVRYKVKVPKTATVRASTVNGGVLVNAMDGRVVARTTNGGIRATAITGAIEAHCVNGGVKVQYASTGTAPSELRTVNGGVRVSLPERAKATVSASWVNGGINVAGLPFEITDQARRHFEGRLNGGGATIEVATVNGGVTFGNALDAPASEAKSWDEPQPDEGPVLHERR
jgi:hypothetical protein